MKMTVLAALFAVAISGCHTLRFEITSEKHDTVVFDRKSFFLWGLTPRREVQVTDHCPHGAAAIREQTTFADGLLAAITLGLWVPRSSWYYCLGESHR
jgi:hypothetical protein